MMILKMILIQKEDKIAKIMMLINKNYQKKMLKTLLMIVKMIIEKKKN